MADAARHFGRGRVRRLFGLDRSGPPPRQTQKGEPLNPWTLPNFVGYLRLAAIPVFLWLAFESGDGRTLAAGDRLLADRRGRLPRRLPRPRHRPVQPPGRDARPVHRPAHDPRRRRRLLELRAAAALGAGPARRCASWRCCCLAQYGATPWGRDPGQLAGPDLGLPDHGRHLLRAGLRRLGSGSAPDRRPRPGDHRHRPLRPRPGSRDQCARLALQDKRQAP